MTRPWRSNRPGDLGTDRERFAHGRGGDPGLVERELDARVTRNVDRLVGGQRADDAQVPGGLDGPGMSDRAIGSAERESIGLAGDEALESGRRVMHVIAGRFAAERQLRFDGQAGGERRYGRAVEAR